MADYSCPSCGNNLRNPKNISRVYVNSIPWWKFDSSSVKLPLKLRCNSCEVLLTHNPIPSWVIWLFSFNLAIPVFQMIFFDAQFFMEHLEHLIYWEGLILGLILIPLIILIIENLTSKRHVYTIWLEI
jgi:hypothetical protein